MSDIFHAHDDGPELAPIRRVQNLNSRLSFSQSVSRVGSEWTREVEHNEGFVQTFSDFYGEDVESAMALTSAFVGNFEFDLEATNQITLQHTNTVAGGRVATSLYAITYDTAGPSASRGLVAYIDSSDGEAKLASYNGNADVVGFLAQAASAGDVATIQTEGVIDLADWTNVAGVADLTPGSLYFLHENGQIRTTAPVDGQVVVVGRAMTARQLDSEIDSPLVL